MRELIRFEQNSEGIAVLTFNRPEVLNALSLAMMRRFAEVVADVAESESVRVLILTGAGERAFCSGGDLVELSHHPTEDDARAFITLMGDALRQMEMLPFPVIAAMNGYALGGGSEIALACDLRFADANIKMGMVQIKNGLTPGWGAGQRLARLVSYSQAIGLMLSGAVLQSDDVLRHGLVNEVVEAGEALNHAMDFARGIAAQSPDVVRGIKQLLQAGWHHPYEEALQIEREVFPPLWAADAHVEAVERFLTRQQDKHKR